MKKTAVLVVLLALAAFAEDGSSRLPFTPFAGAKEGDYAVFSVGTRTITSRVVAVTSGSVAFERNGERVAVVTSEAPTVADFFGKWEKSRISAWRVIDDTFDLGGKHVACKRLSFSVRTKDEHVSVTLWFSSQVKGSGVVAMKKRVLDEKDQHPRETRLVEWGNGAQADWKAEGR